jgi:hypothetical protein
VAQQADVVVLFGEPVEGGVGVRCGGSSAGRGEEGAAAWCAGAVADYRHPHYPGDGFSAFDDRRAEVEGYRGAETITDPARLEVFRKAFSLLQSSALYGQDARDLVGAALAAT